MLVNIFKKLPNISLFGYAQWYDLPRLPSPNPRVSKYLQVTMCGRVIQTQFDLVDLA